MTLVLFFLLFIMIETVDLASAFQSTRPHGINIRSISLSSLNQIPLPSDGNSDSSDLLERAARLRKEIEELETKASSKRPKGEASQIVEKAVEYSDISDSIWTLSYRFSDQPEPSDDEDEGAMKQPRRFFRGKLTLHFRSDGYTDIVAQEALGTEMEKANIVKAWGWDIEESNEDGEQEYLLFSIDVGLPSSDGEKAVRRFYFQARQDKNTISQAISLTEGTVTIKKDVLQKSARWGFFSPAGILAQFRYVGDFIAKPSSVTAS